MTDYSCALVGDILLQGHLYVTYNYFAFHSNVFGYVRKVSSLFAVCSSLQFVINLSFLYQLLIPMADVRKITKEKTAKFFPNAIAISTNTEKHLFSSLMSRDVAYRLALSVWKKFHYPNRIDDIDGERVINVELLFQAQGFKRFSFHNRKMKARLWMENIQATSPLKTR